MTLLTALDQDVEVVIKEKPRSRRTGRIRIVAPDLRAMSAVREGAAMPHLERDAPLVQEDDRAGGRMRRDESLAVTPQRPALPILLTSDEVAELLRTTRKARLRHGRAQTDSRRDSSRPPRALPASGIGRLAPPEVLAIVGKVDSDGRSSQTVQTRRVARGHPPRAAGRDAGS